jgi:hypothetical protein
MCWRSHDLGAVRATSSSGMNHENGDHHGGQPLYPYLFGVE